MKTYYQLDNSPFPIQGDWSREHHQELRPSNIPTWLAEIAYCGYVKMHGPIQSFTRIKERGGFGRSELLLYLKEGIPVAEIPE